MSDLPLHDAVRRDDLAAVDALIDARPEALHDCDGRGRTALHLAAERSDPRIVRHLLARGADAVAADRDGLTPLHLAAQRGSARLIRVLLRGGAQVDARTGRGDTPLHVATANSRPEAAAALLEGGADPNARNRDRQTPLHVGPRGVVHPERHRAALSALFEHGADPLARDTAGRTPLHTAVEACPALRSADCGPPDWPVPGYVPRHATMHDFLPLLDALMAHADVLRCDAAEPPFSLLHMAAARGLADVVEYALERGWPVDLADDRGWTALHYAAINRYAPVMDLLWRAGAVESADHAGRTPTDLLREGRPDFGPRGERPPVPRLCPSCDHDTLERADAVGHAAYRCAHCEVTYFITLGEDPYVTLNVMGAGHRFVYHPVTHRWLRRAGHAGLDT